jgi:hypothetical protein
MNASQEKRTMTKVDVGQLAEAMALGIGPAETVHPAHSAAFTLLDVHPAPWSYQEEVAGRPVSRRYQEEPDAHTDDGRGQYVVRDAHDGVVVEIFKFSKSAAEKLARAIADIPVNMAEIEKLSAGNEQLKEVAAQFDELARSAAQESTNLRSRVADLEATIAKLNAELGEALKAGAPRAHIPRQTQSSDDARIALAAELLVESGISVPDLARILARTVERIEARDDAKAEKIASIISAAAENALFNGGGPEIFPAAARTVLEVAKEGGAA